MLLQEGVKLPAPTGVPDASVEAGLGNSNRAPGHAVASQTEGGKDDGHQTEPRPSDKILPRYFTLPEVDLGCHRRPQAQQSGNRLDPDAGPIPFNEEGSWLIFTVGQD